MDNAKDKQRLTIEVENELKKRAKVEAARTGKSIKDILEELIRRWLDGDIKLDQPK